MAGIPERKRISCNRLGKKGMITKRKITQKISPIISIDNNNKDVNKQQQQPPIFGGGVK